MTRLIFISFLIGSFHLEAQERDTTRRGEDAQPVKKNLRYFFGHIPLRTVHRSAKFDVQIDTRNSFVKDFPINLYGVNVGIILRERFRLGGGYYWFNQSFNNKPLGIATNTFPNQTLIGRVIVTAKGVPIPVKTLDYLAKASPSKVPPGSYVEADQQIDLWFASIGFMYTFYVSELVEFAIPIEIGYGAFNENLYISPGDLSKLGTTPKPKATTGNFVPGQIGFDVLIKPHRWVYFEGSIGYRQTLIQNYTTQYRATSFDSQFNGEYYNIGVKIQLGTIVKEWKSHRKKKKEQKSPAK
jgi:hypothetical protein